MEKIFTMQNNEFTWREFRTHTIMFSQIPCFVDTKTTKTPNYLHHASMYGILKEDAQIQTRLGNTKNREVIHYSSELVIDTDNDETAEKVWNALHEKDLSFELYKLNNCKFYLQRNDNDIPSTEMCYKDRQFVRDNFYICSVNNGLDTGIYSSPFHLCRAKNAIHEVTGAKSKLIYTYKGQNKINTKDIVLKSMEKQRNNQFDTNSCEWAQLQTLLTFASGESGSKHLSIWKFAKDIAKFVSFNAGLELAMIYAKSMDYDENKAQRAFKQGFETIIC